VESTLRGSAPADLRLIETFRWEPGRGFLRWPAHLARLRGAAAALGIGFDPAEAERALEGVFAAEPLRVRLTLGMAGDVEVAAVPLSPAKPEWAVAVAPARLRSRDPWLRLKSTRRPLHDAARQALTAGVDEAIFLNERAEVAEGTITNVFLDLGAGLVTPPVSAGLLPGVLRAEMLAAGACREAEIDETELRRGRLYVGNSLRGLVPTRLVEG
jgi:4-amino-4-deoxychorismate lyase